MHYRLPSAGIRLSAPECQTGTSPSGLWRLETEGILNISCAGRLSGGSRRMGGYGEVANTPGGWWWLMVDVLAAQHNNFECWLNGGWDRSRRIPYRVVRQAGDPGYPQAIRFGRPSTRLGVVGGSVFRSSAKRN